jgi:hypothetical protein
MDFSEMKLDPHGLQLTSLLLGIEAGAGQPELYELEADENLLRVPWPEKKKIRWIQRDQKRFRT